MVARGSKTRFSVLWPLPYLHPDADEWLFQLAEVISRRRVNKRGYIEPISGSELVQLVSRLEPFAERIPISSLVFETGADEEPNECADQLALISNPRYFQRNHLFSAGRSGRRVTTCRVTTTLRIVHAALRSSGLSS